MLGRGPFPRRAQSCYLHSEVLFDFSKSLHAGEAVAHDINSCGAPHSGMALIGNACESLHHNRSRTTCMQAVYVRGLLLSTVLDESISMPSCGLPIQLHFAVHGTHGLLMHGTHGRCSSAHIS